MSYRYPVVAVRIRREDGLWDIQRERGPSATHFTWLPESEIPQEIVERVSLIMLQGKDESTDLGRWRDLQRHVFVTFADPITTET